MKRKPKKRAAKRPRGRPPRFTIAQVAAAVAANKGFLYLAAKALGCHHSTLIDYRKKHPAIAAAFDTSRGEMIDTAELSLYNAVLKGEAWAVCFLLKTQGKERGYVEKQTHEHAGPDGGPIPVAAEVSFTDADISAQLAKYAAGFESAAQRHAAEQLEQDGSEPPGGSGPSDGLQEPVPETDSAPGDSGASG